jgi:hypothetical protein
MGHLNVDWHCEPLLTSSIPREIILNVVQALL